MLTFIYWCLQIRSRVIRIPEEKPKWLNEYRRRTSLIETIDKAFQIDCNCEVCVALREAAKDLGELFVPGGKPG